MRAEGGGDAAAAAAVAAPPARPAGAGVEGLKEKEARAFASARALSAAVSAACGGKAQGQWLQQAHSSVSPHHT